MPAEHGITRRSLLTAAAAAAGGLVLPRGAGARTALDPADGGFGHLRPTATDARSLGLIPPTLPAGPGQPPIIAREAWAQGGCTPRVAPEYGAVRVAFVHHTENPNGYLSSDVPAMLRAIFHFHRDIKGWNDIGYNFVVDRFGRIFEARAGGIDEPVIGAQAGGYNYRSTGVAVLGEYGAQRISTAAYAALARLLAWKLSLHGQPLLGATTVRVTRAGAVYSRFPAGAPVALPRIAGHRDADSTSCPGNALYGELPALRTAAARLGGRAAQVTLGVQLDPASGVPAALAGTLALLAAGAGGGGGAGEGGAGGAIAGAPIEVQARSVARHGQLVRERTLAQTHTGPDGSFSLPLAPVAGRGAIWVRALCPGGAGVPAAVSDPLRLPASVALSATGPAPPSGQTPAGSSPAAP